MAVRLLSAIVFIVAVAGAVSSVAQLDSGDADRRHVAGSSLCRTHALC
jgi:hypothetical protein